MRLKEVKDFGFVLDAIEMMPKKKHVRVSLKKIDRALAFVIATTWAVILYLWQRAT